MAIGRILKKSRMKYYYAIAFCNIFLFGVKAFFEFSYCVYLFIYFLHSVMDLCNR